MQLTHSFTVPAPVDEAFDVLRDIERIAPCMPGATLGEVDGEDFTGKVKVKVGPIQVTYQGKARFVEVDEARYRAVLEANGKEARGAGTARATITAECRAKGAETDVTVFTDLAITGKPAQFGRGVMSDVGEKLLGQFADCLSSELAQPEATAAEPPEPAESAKPAAASAPAAAPRVEGVAPPERRTDDAIDLLDVAGAPLAKRVGPVVAAAAAVALLVWLLRRLRA